MIKMYPNQNINQKINRNIHWEYRNMVSTCAAIRNYTKGHETDVSIPADF